MIDDFSGLKFGLTIAKELLDHHQVLTRGQRGKREEFVVILVKAYSSRGGSEDMILSNPLRSVRKLFPERGEENERFRKLARGLYEYIGTGDGSGSSDALPLPGNDNGSSIRPLTPDREWGEGVYEVYAWCLPQDENTGDRWAIKIGFAEKGFNQRWHQFKTDLPVLPRYLRAFRYETEAQAIRDERFLKDMLSTWDRRVEGIPAVEWFYATPAEIDRLIEMRYSGSL